MDNSSDDNTNIKRFFSENVNKYPDFTLKEMPNYNNKLKEEYMINLESLIKGISIFESLHKIIKL